MKIYSLMMSNYNVLNGFQCDDLNMIMEPLFNDQ